MRIGWMLSAAALVLVTTGCGIGDSQRHLRTAVDARQDALESCYASALERDAGAAGSVQAWLYVEDEAGRIERVEVVESDLSDDQLHACMDEALRQVQLAETPPANLKVEYTFQFQPRN